MGTPAIKITEKWQFTIPSRFRSLMSIQPGDYLEPEVKRGVLVLRPRKQVLIDPDQEWFWSKEWQEREREVEEEVRKGKVKRASDLKSLMRDLGK